MSNTPAQDIPQEVIAKVVAVANTMPSMAALIKLNENAFKVLLAKRLLPTIPAFVKEFDDALRQPRTAWTFPLACMAMQQCASVADLHRRYRGAMVYLERNDQLHAASLGTPARSGGRARSTGRYSDDELQVILGAYLSPSDASLGNQSAYRAAKNRKLEIPYKSGSRAQQVAYLERCIEDFEDDADPIGRIKTEARHIVIGARRLGVLELLLSRFPGFDPEMF